MHQCLTRIISFIFPPQGRFVRGLSLLYTPYFEICTFLVMRLNFFYKVCSLPEEMLRLAHNSLVTFASCPPRKSLQVSHAGLLYPSLASGCVDLSRKPLRIRLHLQSSVSSMFPPGSKKHFSQRCGTRVATFWDDPGIVT